MRSASSWTRDDSLVVLASYLARPARMSLPPPMERRKVADQLRVSPAAVAEHLWMFAELDENNPTENMGHAGHDERALWKRFGDDPLACFVRAEGILERARQRPQALFGRERGPLL